MTKPIVFASLLLACAVSACKTQPQANIPPDMSAVPAYPVTRIIPIQEGHAAQPVQRGETLYYYARIRQQENCIGMTMFALNMASLKTTSQVETSPTLNQNCFQTYAQTIELDHQHFLVRDSNHTARIVQHKEQTLQSKVLVFPHPETADLLDVSGKLEAGELANHVVWPSLSGLSLHRKVDLKRGNTTPVWHKNFSDILLSDDSHSFLGSYAIDPQTKTIYLATNGLRAKYTSILALNEHGQTLWQKDFVTQTPQGSMTVMNLALMDKKLVFLNDIDDLYALDPQKGNVLWKTPDIKKVLCDGPQHSLSFFEAEGNRLFFFPRSGTCFTRLDLETGQVKWNLDLRQFDASGPYTILSRPVLVRDRLYIPNHRMYVINADTGQLEAASQATEDMDVLTQTNNAIYDPKQDQIVTVNAGSIRVFKPLP